MSTLQIETPRAFLPLLQRKRYKGLHGGRGGAKSHDRAGALLEEHLLIPGTRSVCLREVQRSLDQSVKRLLEDKIIQYGLHREFRVMDTEIRAPGGGIIIFEGMQNHTAASIKSLEAFRIGWFEEAQTCSQRSLNMLRPTFFRVPDSELWFTWNPRDPKDPVDAMFRGPEKLGPDDATCIQVNYPDNPWFPPDLRKEMEGDLRRDIDKYNHVWLGGYERRTQSRVFKNVRVEDFTLPANTHFYVGSDWGFSVDPSTLVRCAEVRVNWLTGQEWPRKRLYIDYDFYKKGVEIDHLPAYFDGLVCGCEPQLVDGRLTMPPCQNPPYHAWARSQAIIADSARPETISYFRRHGYPGMEPAKKGANSVKEGVMFLDGYDIIIHPRCKATIEEFGGYSYVVDKLTDQVTGELEDTRNHIIDPVRYAVEQLRGALVIRRAVWG